jgi:hypothetical protein
MRGLIGCTRNIKAADSDKNEVSNGPKTDSLEHAMMANFTRSSFVRCEATT